MIFHLFIYFNSIKKRFFKDKFCQIEYLPSQYFDYDNTIFSIIFFISKKKHF